MSWASIRAAIATRLSAIAQVGTVSQYEKGLTDSPETATFLAAFAEGGKLNTVWITRTGRSTRRPVADDSRVIRRHGVRLVAVYAFGSDGSSAQDFDALLDAVCDNLESGDKTLGGTAQTYSLPEAASIRITDYADQITVHAAEIRFEVDEVANA